MRNRVSSKRGNHEDEKETTPDFDMHTRRPRAVYPKYTTATKALRTNARGLPRPAALLLGALVVELGALDDVAEPVPEVVVPAEVLEVEVKVAMLKVVLRLIGMPVPLAVAPAPAVTPVPTTAVVVALKLGKVEVVVALAVDGRGTGTTGVATEVAELDDAEDEDEDEDADEVEPPERLNRPE